MWLLTGLLAVLGSVRLISAYVEHRLARPAGSSPSFVKHLLILWGS